MYNLSSHKLSSHKMNSLWTLYEASLKPPQKLPSTHPYEFPLSALPTNLYVIILYQSLWFPIFKSYNLYLTTLQIL